VVTVAVSAIGGMSANDSSLVHEKIVDLLTLAQLIETIHLS
jgi:hypothetical protein